MVIEEESTGEWLAFVETNELFRYSPTCSLLARRRRSN